MLEDILNVKMTTLHK